MMDLLPCPFCGTEPALISEGDFHSVACPHYYCNFSQIALRSAKKAIDRWNMREQPAGQNELNRRSRNATIEDCARVTARWGDGPARLAAEEIRLLKSGMEQPAAPDKETP